MKTGVIKFFNEEKGYGFITQDGSGSDLFVHVSGLESDVQKDDKVEYEIQDGRKGPTAVSVRVIG